MKKSLIVLALALLVANFVVIGINYAQDEAAPMAETENTGAENTGAVTE